MSTSTKTAASPAEQLAGLFRACFQTPGQIEGLSLQLLVDAPESDFSGLAILTDNLIPIQPPAENTYRITGSYQTLVFGAQTQISGRFSGSIRNAAGSGQAAAQQIGGDFLINGWDGKGTVTYRYQDASGKWHDVVNAEMNHVPCK